MQSTSNAPASFDRLLGRAHPQQLPQPVPNSPGMYLVDATWGTIQPMQVAEGVLTVSELDVIEHLRQRRPLVDARTRDSNGQATIPGAVSLPHTEVAGRREELDLSWPTIFFCNGPQCGQSRSAIEALLDTGYPADAVLYYRGGLHDWVTLGLPTESWPALPELDSLSREDG